MKSTNALTFLAAFVFSIGCAQGNENLSSEDIPEDITKTKRGLGLTSWNQFEKQLEPRNVNDACARTESLSKNIEEDNSERGQRFKTLKVNPEIPLSDCKRVFPALNRKCLDIARDFYIHHYISDSVTQPLVSRVVSQVIYTCPLLKMLGFEVDAHKLLENLKKSE